MQGSLEQPPIVVRGKRTRPIWLLVFFGFFFVLTLTGAVSSRSGITPATAGVLALFAFCIGVFIWMAASPPRLEIRPEGISQTVLWRRRTYGWADVYNFRPALIGLSTKTVGFDYLRPAAKGVTMRSVNTAIAGVQGSLYAGWQVDPVTLANLLNTARERWLADIAATAVAPGETHPLTAPREISPSPVSGFVGARMNRKVYWICVAVIVAVSLAIYFVSGHSSGVIGTIFLIRVYAVRLHDIGRSGWWQVLLYLAEIAALIVVLVIDPHAMDTALLVASGLQALFTIGLGAIAGNPGHNRFGPPPGQPTAIAQSEVFR